MMGTCLSCHWAPTVMTTSDGLWHLTKNGLRHRYVSVMTECSGEGVKSQKNLLSSPQDSEREPSVVTPRLCKETFLEARSLCPPYNPLHCVSPTSECQPAPPANIPFYCFLFHSIVFYSILLCSILHSPGCALGALCPAHR